MLLRNHRRATRNSVILFAMRNQTVLPAAASISGISKAFHLVENAMRQPSPAARLVAENAR